MLPVVPSSDGLITIKFPQHDRASHSFLSFFRVVRIVLLDHEFEVLENNTLLRGLQYLAPEPVSYGRFCWNEDCQYCRVTFDQGEGTSARAALA